MGRIEAGTTGFDEGAKRPELPSLANFVLSFRPSDLRASSAVFTTGLVAGAECSEGGVRGGEGRGGECSVARRALRRDQLLTWTVTSAAPPRD